jgi:hypothetical protein
MIADYDDDKKMAEAGRKSVKWKAINNAKETIRNGAVALGNTLVIDEIKFHQAVMNQAIDNLIEALEL